VSTGTGLPELPPDRPLTPGEALAKLFMDNADRGANHDNDELVAALRQRAREIQALADLTRCGGSAREDEGLTGIPGGGDDPELTAAIRQAQACGFHFTRPSPGAAWC
jgi:hypothetical protein